VRHLPVAYDLSADRLTATGNARDKPYVDGNTQMLTDALT